MSDDSTPSKLSLAKILTVAPALAACLGIAKDAGGSIAEWIAVVMLSAIWLELRRRR